MYTKLNDLLIVSILVGKSWYVNETSQYDWEI